MNRASELEIGEFFAIRSATVKERRNVSVSVARLNKRYREDRRNPSTLVMETNNGRLVVVRYAGILDKVGGRYLIPRNPIMDL